MLNETEIVTIGLFFIIAVLLYVLQREHITLAQLVPSEVVRDIIVTAVNAALDQADNAALATATKADDELVALIRQEVAAALTPPPIPPSSNVTLFPGEAAG